MDERLSKALEFSNYMTTINNQKRMFKEQYFENLIYFYQGGQFTVTKELVTFISLLINQNNVNDVVLIDDNDRPIMIDNLEDFFDNILDTYFTASNKYYQNYASLSKKRNVELLISNE